MSYRLLQPSDFNKGFLDLLSQLTTVGEISKSEFRKRFFEIIKNKNHRVYVLEQGNKIVSCATLLLEPKYIHNCGFVGHIEDVVVDKACRGQKLGKKIIDFLTSEAERLGCYKILLDCSDHNVGFYEKCEYARKGAYMAKYLNPDKTITEQSKKTTMGYISKFCYKYRTPLIIGLSAAALASGYYIYKNYYDIQPIPTIEIREITKEETEAEKVAREIVEDLINEQEILATVPQ